MQLDDFKSQWNVYSQKLDKTWQLNLTLLRETRWRQTRSALRKLAAAAWVELFINLALVMALGGFIAAHLWQWAFLLPAFVLHAFAIAQMAFNGYQLGALREVDFGAPLLSSQKKLAGVRRWRIRATMGTFVLAPLLWLPMLIVMLKGLLGIDAYAVLDTSWLVANALFGVAVIPITLWIANRFRAHWQNSPRFQQFLDDVAGRSLREAETYLKELSDFERGIDEA